jgi:ATP-dependent helicase HepA
MGRIKERHDDHVQVDLPDGESVFVTEAQIYVRCARASDPIDTLLVRGHETAFFQVPRTRFVRSVLRQRAAYRGLTALASAPIELYPHQVEVIRRVLEDPVQRYLLADEVGLGKTIEAGVIIRQHLLDNPGGEVLVIVPASLLEQWHRELLSRLRLTVRDRIHFRQAEETSEQKYLGVSMVVIDEAHHVAGKAFSTRGADRENFAATANIAHAAESLLLLSATPASSNERQFLAMLHLLDPQTYRLDDLAGFLERVQRRQDIGRLLLTLRDGADPFILGMAVKRLRETFPSDVGLDALVTELQSELSAEPSQGEVDALVRRIRILVSETYRIHRRMLRSRREQLAGTSLARRAPEEATTAPFVIVDDDARVIEAHDLIDDWRAYAFEALSTSSYSEEERRKAESATISLLQRFLQSAATSLSQLDLEVTARLRDTATHSSIWPPTVVPPAIAMDAPCFAEEAPILQRLLLIARRPAEQITREERLMVFLKETRVRAGIRPPPKCVVFCQNERVCAELGQALASRLGRPAVALVTVSSKTIPETINHFQNNRDCFVLIADAAAEEGLNLQFAEYLVLMDLPWSPNRLEQRIGRLDRIGRTRPVRTIVFISSPGPASIYEAWLEVLRDGLGVFNESIAGLQFFVEEKVPALNNALLSEGAHGLRRQIKTLQEAMVTERVRLREQAALDEIDAQAEHASRFFQVLDDIDTEANLMQEAFEGWACTVLRLERDKSLAQEHVVRYVATKQSLIPASVLRTGNAFQLEEKCTFRRGVAVAGEGISLVRIGYGLVDNLWQYVQWDDRGRAYAFWRQQRSFDSSEGADWLGFKLHYLIEADVEPIRRAVESSSLPEHSWRPIHRRADALLQPFMDVMYFDINGHEVSDPELLGFLRRPFERAQDGGTDTNLHKDRLSILDSLVAPGHWEWACRAARSASEASLRQRGNFRERVAIAYHEATRQVEEEAALLAARASASHDLMIDSLGIARDIEAQSILGRALLDAIAHPAVRLDSVGFIVLSGRPPLAVR